MVALLALWIPATAFSADAPDTTTEDAASAEDANTDVRRGLFPPLRQGKKAEASPAHEVTKPVGALEQPEPVATSTHTVTKPAGPVADLPAADAPDEGVMQWVERLEGEVPSQAQLAALEELQKTETAERALIDELSGGDVPLAFYRDPRAALAVDPLHLDEVNPEEFDIPVVVNDDVRKWVKYFTGPGRKYYARWLSRSTRFRPMMYRELEAEGLPRDLVYLSMIESGYNAHAYSHAAAAGLWQFIPSTARLYKMRVDWWVDDRRDPDTSLHAAMALLGDLHDMFGKWELAWAAYNTGPGRVRRAASKAGTEDFWTIAHGPYLHSETDNYVPKIMAAAIIGHHPERYGFTDIVYQDELAYEVARVDGSVELAVLARCAGTTTDTIKALNPALRRFATPPEGYDVRLPIGSGATFVAALAKVPKNKRVTVVKHTVKRGETLSGIATRHGVSLNTLSSANNLRNANRIYVGMSLVIPKNGYVPSSVASSGSTRSKTVTKSVSSYKVRSGDTLGSIAKRHGTSVSAIKSRNGLGSDTIQVGQTLKLTGSASSGGSTATTVTYKVRNGDNLSSIASRHGVSTSDLQRWNGIGNASHIQVGQTLKIKGSSSGWATYNVRSGDSLGKIASRNSCSVGELQSWNNLSGTTIHPGQTLKIRRN
jgi:membrane-bound lytic murein transglycosylase D